MWRSMPNPALKLSLQYPPEAFDASGAFETCRVAGGRVLRISEHLDRLRGSLRTLSIVSFREPEIRRALIRAAVRTKNGFIRVAIRRWGAPPWVIHCQQGLPYTKSEFQRGISLRTAATRIPSTESLPSQTKHSQRLSGILGRLEGGGSPEVLRLGSHGYVTEGTVSNLFLVKEGVLMTAPCWLGALGGVTRDRVINAAGRLKIPLRETPFTRHDLFNADEAFLTNVLMEMAPVREVDGRTIGGPVPGPVTKRLMSAIQKR